MSIILTATAAPAPEPKRTVTPVYNGTVKASVMSVTPRMAEEWLIRNTHNRNVTDNVVKRIARDILNGQYHLNGETIKLAMDGTVLDGQHRLWAIMESGIGVWTVVITGLPMEAQDTVDRVKTRGIADALRMAGVPSANVLAGAISSAIIIQSDTPGDLSKGWPSVPEALDYLDKHPQIHASIPIGEALSRVMKTSSVSAAGLHHVFAMIDEEDADFFFDKLTTGADLAADSPIYRLRDFMHREITVQRRVNRVRLHAYYIKAWNAYREGRTLQFLKWSTGGSHPESFPKPV